MKTESNKSFPEWASSGGQDQYGVFVEFTLGEVTQRLRWIPPGEFLMGSPEDEPARYDDEGPRHPVTLTQGFWLADTACTQALWQAVMGDNPSRFQSPTRPVERVSWDEVQQFIERLNSLIPDGIFRLPTEAEWEYACRAGTTTAIYTGDLTILSDYNVPTLDPIAWYGGNSGVNFDLENGEDSSGWLRKQYSHIRAGTRIVKLKQPNSWGLYDMLGNVWECCQDGRRGYVEGAVTDPVGPVRGNGFHIVRGGSWRCGSRNVRAAYRGLVSPGDPFVDLGFRCVRVQS